MLGEGVKTDLRPLDQVVKVVEGWVDFGSKLLAIRTAHIRHQFRKTTVLSRHRCLINTGVEKMNNIITLTTRCLSKSECWYSNNC
jgi:hypothetical protein